MKPHTVFVRMGCVLPDRFDLRQEPLSDGWATAIGTLVAELDARIRGVGWHFMWIVGSYTAHALGRTPESATHRALTQALQAVKRRFNAAELESTHVTGFPGFRMARVTVEARQIQKQTSLD